MPTRTKHLALLARGEARAGFQFHQPVWMPVRIVTTAIRLLPGAGAAEHGSALLARRRADRLICIKRVLDPLPYSAP